MTSSLLGTSVAWCSCGDYVIVLGSRNAASVPHTIATDVMYHALRHRRQETPSPICHGANCKSRTPLSPLPEPTRQIDTGDQWACVASLSRVSHDRELRWRIEGTTLTLDGYPSPIERPPRS